MPSRPNGITASPSRPLPMTANGSPARDECDLIGKPIASADPRLGVVVLTHNRADELLRTLEHLTALPAQPEIVVVDNASVDDIPQLVRSHFPHIRCVRSNQNL